MTQTPEFQKKPVTFSTCLSFIWHYWSDYPVRFASVVAMMFVMILCEVLLPVFAGRIVDAVALGVDQGASRDQIIVGALWAFGGFIAVETCYFLLRFASDRNWVWIASETMRRIVNDVFDRVQRFSTDWHANAFGGATVRKITRGKWAYDALADAMFFGFAPTLLVVIGLSVMLAMQWTIMGVILFVGITLMVALNYVLITYFNSPTNKAFNEQDTRLGAVLADSITCNAVVKSFGSEDREFVNIQQATEEWRFRGRRTWNRGMITHTIHSLALVVLVGVMIGTSLWLWKVGLATPGQVVTVLTSYFVIGGYMRSIGQHMREAQRAINEMEDIIHFLDQPLGVVDEPDAAVLEVPEGEIDIDKITFTYKNQGNPLFEDLSLQIKPGEKVALVGHSGSGKSSFVKLVQRLYDVNAGAIRIDGTDIAEVEQSSLRAAIALVPQEPILFHRSLRDNIAYGRPDATLEEVISAAKRAHAHEFIHQLKEGYDTLVGERGIKLSGGERQRVALARAFLADCPILILDEATSSLDSHTEAFIQESMADLMEGRTTIVIAHRLSTIRQVDRILVFDQGQIIEEGSHEELMAEDSHYRSLVAVQMLDEGELNRVRELAS